LVTKLTIFGAAIFALKPGKRRIANQRFCRSFWSIRQGCSWLEICKAT
jgi:hypothetical protein